MATQTGQRTTLIDTVGHAVDMSPIIQLIDPFDVGLLSYIGMNSLDKPATEVRHQWMEDTLRPTTGALGAALTNAATTATVVSSVPFRKGDLILIGPTAAGLTEVVLVTDVPSGTTLTLETRGTRSTGVAFAGTEAVQIIGSAIQEGSTTPRQHKSTEKTSVSNYTQIFEDVVEVSSTLEAIEQYAPGSEYARELGKVMKSLFILIDKTLIYSTPYAGSTTLARSMGGILHFLSGASVPAAQKVNASNAQLTQKMMLDALISTYNNGGVVRCHAMTLTQKTAQNKFLNQERRTDLRETMAGSVVDSYLWDQGVVDTVIDRWLPVTHVLGLDTEMLGFGPLASETLGHEILPKQSRLAQRGQITGEYTFEFKSPQTSYYIYNLLTNIT